jgi:hypothetical protein
MEDILVAECGTTIEAGIEDSQASDGLTRAISQLTRLADLVDSAGSALMSYPRDQFASSGVEPIMAEPAILGLDEFLTEWESEINRAAVP